MVRTPALWIGEKRYRELPCSDPSAFFSLCIFPVSDIGWPGKNSMAFFFAVMLRHVAPPSAAPAVTNTIEQPWIYEWFLPECFLRRLLYGACKYSSNPDHQCHYSFCQSQIGRSVMSCICFSFLFFDESLLIFLSSMTLCPNLCSLPVLKFPARLRLHLTSSNYSRSRTNSVTSSM